MLTYCGPIFITPGLMTYPDQMIDNGTYPLINTGQRRLLVTCHHVWQAYLDCRKINPDAALGINLGNGTPDGKMPGESRSTPREIQNYLGRISGPLLDRIDLHIEVPQVKFREMSAAPAGESSAQIRERVIAARKLQHARFANKPKITCNARMGSRELKAFCELDEATNDLLKQAMTEYNLSARAYDRILKVARTIADLAGTQSISSDHISEAIQYRSLDRQLWG
jgi:magnesium chelatase family protein